MLTFSDDVIAHAAQHGEARRVILLNLALISFSIMWIPRRVTFYWLLHALVIVFKTSISWVIVLSHISLSVLSNVSP